jgi:16S rRNA (uracil1498-N3)-methyltransferase
MPRIFVGPDDVDGVRVRIGGPAALHLRRSLRVRPGETLVVVEDGRVEHGVVIELLSEAALGGRVLWSRPATGETALRTHVVQALMQRGMDDAVEALSQVGASHIHPVVTRRTVRQPDDVAADRRLRRWRVIAKEAAQLAGRARPPEVHPIATLATARQALPPDAVLYVAAPHAERPLARAAVASDRPLALAVGPEGGFDDAELEALRAGGAELAHLGARIVPSRLAGAIALCLALQRAGELDAPPAPPPKIVP